MFYKLCSFGLGVGSVHTLPVNFTFKISPQLPYSDKTLNYMISLSDGTSR